MTPEEMKAEIKRLQDVIIENGRTIGGLNAKIEMLEWEKRVLVNALEFPCPEGEV